MHYVIEYDVAAILLSLAVMLGFFRKKILFTNLSKVFTILQVLVITSALFDIITIIFIERPELIPVWLQYVLNICYHSPYQLMAPVFYKCIATAAFQNEANSKKGGVSDWLIWLPCIFTQLLIFTTPITHAFFYFNENLEYCHGFPWFYVSYASSGFYLLMAIAVSFKSKNKLSFNQTATVYLYTVAVIIALLIQMFFPNQLIVSFVSSLGVMLIFLSLDDPSNYLDKNLHTFNSQAFELVVQQLILQKKEVSFFAMQIKDLDHINESLGRRNTDKFLTFFSHRVLAASGKKSVYRITGSRFAVLLPSDKKKQKSVVRKIKAAFSQPFEIDAFSITPSMAMTIFSYPEDADNLDDVMLILENTLADVSEDSIGTIVPANPMILEKKRRNYNINQSLKDAVIKQSFEVVYQPVYSVEKNRFTSAEAFVRLRTSEDKYLEASEFIGIAEQSGLVLEIGDIVLQKVCQFIKNSKITELGIEYISINLSIIQCMQARFSESVIKYLDKEGIDGSRINFEVTEAAAVVATETLKENMHILQNRNVGFSMDNYGKGYSNILCLSDFSFKRVKLDKIMISCIPSENEGINESGLSILKHTIKMVNSLNMKVVAEGAENLQQCNQLIDAGCDFIQGYFYSRPLSGDEFVSFMYRQKK